MSPKIVHWEKPNPPTEQEAEAKLRQEGYTAFSWYDVPGTSYPEHHHHHDECIWVLKGEISFQIEGKEYVVKSGDRIYLPSKTPHTAKIPPHSSTTYIVGEKL